MRRIKIVLAIACASLLTACGSESKTSADAPATNGIIVIPNETEVPEDEAHMQETLTVKDKSGKDYTVNIDVDFEESENPYRRNITSYIMRSPNAAEKEKYVKYMFGEREVYSGDVKDLPRSELKSLLESDTYDYESYKDSLESNNWPENNDFYKAEIERLEAEISLINETLPKADSDYKLITDYNHDVFISYNEDGKQECLEFIVDSEQFLVHKGDIIRYTLNGPVYSEEGTDENKRDDLIKDVLLNFDRNTESIIEKKDIKFDSSAIDSSNCGWTYFHFPLYGDESKAIKSAYTFEFMYGVLTRFVLYDNYVMNDNKENVPLLPIDDIKAALHKELSENSTKYKHSNMGTLDIESIKLDRYAIHTEDSQIELVPAWIIKTSVQGQSIYIDATNGNILPVVYEDANFF